MDSNQLPPAVNTVSQQVSAPVSPVIAPEPRSGGKLKLFILFFAGLFIFLSAMSGLAWAVAYDKIQINNPIIEKVASQVVFSVPFVPKTPKFLLAATALADKKVTKYSFNISASAKDNGLTAVFGTDQFDGEMKGAIDYSDKTNTKVTADISLTKDFSMQLRKKDPLVYFKINKIPPIILSYFGNNNDELVKVFDNWIAYDPATLETEASKNLEEYNKPANFNETLEKISNIFLSEKIIKAIEVSEDDVNDFPAYKMHLQVDKELMDYLDKSIREQQVGTRDVMAGQEKMSDSIKDLAVDIWIDKQDYYIRKVAILMKVVSPDTSSLEKMLPVQPPSVLGAKIALSQVPFSSPTSNQTEIAVSIVMLLSDFGQPVEVEIPERALKPEEFYQLFLSKSEIMQRSVSQVYDTVRLADLLNLQQAIEVYGAEKNRYPEKLDDLIQDPPENLQIGKMPTDPKSKDPYKYSTNPFRNKYWLRAVMEDGTECVATEEVSATSCKAGETKTPEATASGNLGI